MSTSLILRVRLITTTGGVRRCAKQCIEENSYECNCPPAGPAPIRCGGGFAFYLPAQKEPGTPGRPLVPFRKVIDGILFVLRTGCHWKALPSCYGSGSTAHRRFQQWTQAGLIDAIVELMLRWYDRCRGIDWEWQAADTKLLAAPLGGQATGPNPTDRGKSGTKRHLLIDGRGVPLAFHLSAANRHDLKGLSRLLDPEGLFALRPEPSEGAP